MKRFFFYIPIFILAFLISLSSCVQNELGTEEPVDGEDAYVSMSLLASSATANRALTDAEINAWENRINEIWMLLYDETDALKYKFIWKVQNYTDNAPLQLVRFYDKETEQVVVSGTATTTAFTSVAKKIKRGEYRMAVLGNPDQNMFSNLTIDSDLSLLQTAIDGGQQGLDVNAYGSYADDASASKLFFMSNANGLINISKASLKSSEQEAQTAPVAVHLDRLLAKVTVKERSGGVNVITPDVVLDTQRPLKWYLDVINKKTYPIRRFAHLMGGSVMETETNSLTTNRERIYAEDPNFLLADNAEDNFIKWRNGDNPPYATWASVNLQDPSLRTYQYTFENTMNLATQSSDNWSKFTTTIVSELYLIYKNLLKDPANISDENDPGRNYYSCMVTKTNGTAEWRVFTHEQINYWLQSGFPPYTDANEAEVWRLIELKAKEVQRDYANGIADAFNLQASTDPGKDISNYRSYKGITYHPLGLNKYTSPIRHFSGSGTDPRKTVYGYYGVVRNNSYTLTINSISGPGTGVEEWDNRFISTEVNITPWYRRNFQGEDL